VVNIYGLPDELRHLLPEGWEEGYEIADSLNALVWDVRSERDRELADEYVSHREAGFAIWLACYVAAENGVTIPADLLEGALKYGAWDALPPIPEQMAKLHERAALAAA